MDRIPMWAWAVFVVVLVGVAAVLPDSGRKERPETDASKKSTGFAVCRHAVERLAAWDYDWTSYGDSKRFPEVTVADNKIIYAGNAIKMQNGFGAWKQVGYVCEYDTIKKQAFAVILD